MKKKYTKVFDAMPTDKQIADEIKKATSFYEGLYKTYFIESNGKIWLLDIRLIDCKK